MRERERALARALAARMSAHRRRNVEGHTAEVGRTQAREFLFSTAKFHLGFLFSRFLIHDEVVWEGAVPRSR